MKIGKPRRNMSGMPKAPNPRPPAGGIPSGPAPILAGGRAMGYAPQVMVEMRRQTVAFDLEGTNREGMALVRAEVQRIYSEQQRRAVAIDPVTVREGDLHLDYAELERLIREAPAPRSRVLAIGFTNVREYLNRVGVGHFDRRDLGRIELRHFQDREVVTRHDRIVITDGTTTRVLKDREERRA